MKSTEDKATRNPNFGRCFFFERVKLKRDMLLWPNLVIKLHEQGLDYPETHHLVLPTFLFADFLLEVSPRTSMDIKVSLATLMQNNNAESQRQENHLFKYLRTLQTQVGSVSVSENLHPMFSLKLEETRDEVFTQLASINPEEI